MSAIAELLTPATYAAPKAVPAPSPSPTRTDWKRRLAESRSRLEKGQPELEERLAAAKEEVTEAWAAYQAKLVAAAVVENELRAARAGDEREAARASAELAKDPPEELKEFHRLILNRIAEIQRTSAGDHERDRLDAEIHALFRVRDKVTYELAPSGLDGPELRAEISAMIRGVEVAIAGASARDRRVA